MDKPETLAQIRHELNASGANAFLKIPDDIANEFWSWFEDSAIVIPLAESKLDQVIYEGHRSNRCFGNAQSIFYKSGIPYYEGFVQVGLGYIHHGFNVHQNSAHDVTYHSNLDEFLKIHGQPLGPYYAIEIPAELVLQNKDILDAKGYNTPLLIELYKTAR